MVVLLNIFVEKMYTFLFFDEFIWNGKDKYYVVKDFSHFWSIFMYVWIYIKYVQSK